MKGKILLIDDDERIIKMYKKMFEYSFENKECPVLLTAPSVEKSRKLFNDNFKEIIAIVLDGKIEGPDAPNDNTGTYPNSAVLVKEFRTVYAGPIIASSCHETSREILMREGCDHQCDNKAHVVDFIVKLLGL